jgi:hypothetical protein
MLLRHRASSPEWSLQQDSDYGIISEYQRAAQGGLFYLCATKLAILLRCTLVVMAHIVISRHMLGGRSLCDLFTAWIFTNAPLVSTKTTLTT